MRALIALAAAVALCACAPTVAPVAPLPAHCGPIEFMEVEAAPVEPTLSPAERMALYRAVLEAVPLATAKAWFRFHEAELPGYASRMAARTNATRQRCLTSP